MVDAHDFSSVHLLGFIIVVSSLDGFQQPHIHTSNTITFGPLGYSFLTVF